MLIYKKKQLRNKSSQAATPARLRWDSSTAQWGEDTGLALIPLLVATGQRMLLCFDDKKTEENTLKYYIMKEILNYVVFTIFNIRTFFLAQALDTWIKWVLIVWFILKKDRLSWFYAFIHGWQNWSILDCHLLITMDLSIPNWCSTITLEVGPYLVG